MNAVFALVNVVLVTYEKGGRGRKRGWQESYKASSGNIPRISYYLDFILTVFMYNVHCIVYYA